jgi:hypothetical protein
MLEQDCFRHLAINLPNNSQKTAITNNGLLLAPLSLLGPLALAWGWRHFCLTG